jgi:serine transporter
MEKTLLQKEIKKSNKEWTFTFFGTAIGSGILFIPLQAGISGIYVSVITMVLAFSVTYFAQKYYCAIIARCQSADSYNKAIEEYCGYSFSSFISIIFAIQLFVSILIYSTGLNANLGEFLVSYKITSSNLSSVPLFPLLILGVLRDCKIIN